MRSSSTYSTAVAPRVATAVLLSAPPRRYRRGSTPEDVRDSAARGLSIVFIDVVRVLCVRVRARMLVSREHLCV